MKLFLINTGYDVAVIRAHSLEEAMNLVAAEMSSGVLELFGGYVHPDVNPHDARLWKELTVDGPVALIHVHRCPIE
jgi:hypothetical protein